MYLLHDQQMLRFYLRYSANQSIIHNDDFMEDIYVILSIISIVSLYHYNKKHI